MKSDRLLHALLRPDILVRALPAYSLPFLDLGLVGLGVNVLRGTWLWLFGPAVGVHVLLALIAAYRPSPRDLVEQVEIDEQQDLARLGGQLEAGFYAIGLIRGIRTAQDLSYEYTELQPLLDRRHPGDSFSISQVPGLANETYRQGLSVLGDALALSRATNNDEKSRLEGEIKELEEEITNLGSAPIVANRIKIRHDQVSSDRELLAAMVKQSERADELLAQADRCKASLQRARMELGGLRAEGADERVKVVLDTLKRTLDRAKAVKDEMRKIG